MQSTEPVVGSNLAVEQKGQPVSFADLCLFLGVRFAFATVVMRVVEVLWKE